MSKNKTAPLQAVLTWSALVDQTLETAQVEGFDTDWVLDQIAAHGHPPWGVWRKIGFKLGYSIDWVNNQWIPKIEAQFPTFDDFFCQPIDEHDPMFDDLLNLQSQLAEVKNDCDLTTEGIQRLIDNAIAKMSIGTNRKKSQKVASNNPSEGLSISAFSQRHGLEISRSTPAGEVRAVLVEKGLDSDWQYDARNGRFNPIKYVNTANS
jgi:hypothetical protein